MALISSYRNQTGNVTGYSTALIISRKSQTKEMIDWLLMEIGERGKDWLKFYNGYDEDRLYFGSEEDKIKFILRWL